MEKNFNNYNNAKLNNHDDSCSELERLERKLDEAAKEGDLLKRRLEKQRRRHNRRRYEQQRKLAQQQEIKSEPEVVVEDRPVRSMTNKDKMMIGMIGALGLGLALASCFSKHEEEDEFGKLEKLANKMSYLKHRFNQI